MSASPALGDARPLEAHYQRTLGAALAALGFFLLFSTAGVYWSMAVLLVLAVLAPGRLFRTRPLREPLVVTSLLLFAYIALRTFLLDGWTGESVQAVNKYQELLLIPVLWAFIKVARRPQAFANGLIVGSLVFAALHWLAFVNAQVFDFVFHRRISAGYGLAVCSFLLFEHARLGKVPRVAGYAGAAFLAATLLFANSGRTGYVILFVLMLCAGFRAAPKRAKLPALVLAVLVGIGIGALSPGARYRIAETFRDAEGASAGNISVWSSTGTRIELLRTGADIARQHWAIGTGWVLYSSAFRQAAIVRDRLAQDHPIRTGGGQPHNEFLLQFGAGGLPALILYLAWLAAPLVGNRESDRSAAWRGAAACVALSFALNSMFNSVLLDFVEGHFYAALIAWLLVRRVEA